MQIRKNNYNDEITVKKAKKKKQKKKDGKNATAATNTN